MSTINPFFMYKLIILLFIIITVNFISCNNQKQESIQGKWIKGTEEEKLHTIEEQFRGFGVAMMEVGYRYQELYWAIKDSNWAYADHQLHEMEEAFANALQRRPERTNSAQLFLNGAFKEMETFVQKEDNSNLDVIYANFTNACNTCHAMEQHGFVTVKTPIQRQSPVR